jgi:hypothetical protein
VKKELAIMSKFVVGFAWMVITFWGCTDEINKAGLGILPTGDLVSVNFTDKASIKAYNLNDEKQRTDESLHNLIGTINDPVFGKTTADFACQFRLSSFPLYKPNDIIDSLVYYIAYKEIYGDTITTQKFKIYELNSDLVFDDKYFQDFNLKEIAKSEVLAEMEYRPRFKDTLQSATSTVKDTVIQEIAFKLDHSLALKLMSADSATLSSNDPDIKTGNKGFINYFKGLYIEAGDVNEGGTIIKVYGSGLMLYYRKVNDTIKYKQSFNVSTNAARVNRFAHDYSKTTFYPTLNAETNQENYLYLQPTGGLRSKILIPNLGSWSKLIPEMANNSDTAYLAINKAELIFQIDPSYIDTVKFLPPSQILLAAIGPGKSKIHPDQDSIYYPSDYYFSNVYFGGYYNNTDKTYRFNIAKHMQEIIEKKKQNLGFYLETINKNSNLRRVVLEGTKGIKFEITYSKIN